MDQLNDRVAWLAGVLSLYWLYNRLIGIDKMKLA